MKYMRQLSVYAKAVKDFPHNHLHVSCTVTKEHAKATISWSEGMRTVTKTIAEMPTHLFRSWYRTEEAKRRVQWIVMQSFADAEEYPFDGEKPVGQKLRAKSGRGRKAKTYLFMKDGEEVIIQNLPDYCHETGICITNFRTLIKGTKKEWRGWSFVRVMDPPQ